MSGTITLDLAHEHTIPIPHRHLAPPGSVGFVGTAQAASSLGDLASFREIVVDTQALVDKGDLAAAKTRIKDLETNWDDAEPSLKPRAAGEWDTIDKAIDAPLNALRTNEPDVFACKQTLANVLTKIDATSHG